MNRSLRRTLATIGAALMTTGTAACSSVDGGDAEAPATVESVLAESAAAMASVESLHFVVRRTGTPVSIDPEGLLVFEEADGRYAAPGSADAVVEVTVLGNRLQVGAVAIDDQLWLTDPITGDWNDATGTIDFDPAGIFRPDTGIAAVLDGGLEGAVLASPEPDADGRYQIDATVTADEVSTLTSGLVSLEADATIWIDAETDQVTEILFDTALDDGIATWNVLLSDYGSDVVIEPPDTAGG